MVRRRVLRLNNARPSGGKARGRVRKRRPHSRAHPHGALLTPFIILFSFFQLIFKCLFCYLFVFWFSIFTYFFLIPILVFSLFYPSFFSVFFIFHFCLFSFFYLFLFWSSIFYLSLFFISVYVIYWFSVLFLSLFLFCSYSSLSSFFYLFLYLSSRDICLPFLRPFSLPFLIIVLSELVLKFIVYSCFIFLSDAYLSSLPFSRFTHFQLVIHPFLNFCIICSFFYRCHFLYLLMYFFRLFFRTLFPFFISTLIPS